MESENGIDVEDNEDHKEATIKPPASLINTSSPHCVTAPTTGDQARTHANKDKDRRHRPEKTGVKRRDADHRCWTSGHEAS